MILKNSNRVKLAMFFVIASMFLAVPGYTSSTALSEVAPFDRTALPVNQAAHDAIAEQKVDTYIVMMLDLPAVSYEGEINGFEATKAPVGEKVNPNSAHVSRYVNYLVNSHEVALESVNVDSGSIMYDYTYAANGFVVEMTAFEAAALEKRSDVFSVLENEVLQLQTDSSGSFLGLDDRWGAWDFGLTGEDVVIGIVDTGIWPEHASFADDGTYGAAPEGFVGTGCEFGDVAANPLDAAFECNNKLLAAKAFNTWSYLDANEYNSARDSDGHGSHTASTAAGNAGVDASIGGAEFGAISGVAPRARVSAYKVCWNDAGCLLADLVAGIDSAVADGVDVINYSIGSSSYAIGADDISFLFAADAGIFVATSNGNSGPGASTTGSPASSPWVTSVGASSQTRTFEGTVTLGDGSVFTGVTLTGGTGELDLVDSADHGNTLCDPAVAFTGDIVGKMVLCERGVFARVAKSQAVWEQGGAGMILFNPALDSLVTDNHHLPSIHVDHVVGPQIKDYIALSAGSATAELSGGQAVDGQGSVMAAFSSRGPNRQSADVIKPDVTAPGVNILAANTLTPYLGAAGESFQAISGTSMASPHVAGLFALLAQAHPDWSAAMAKSALMTTSRQDVLKEDGLTDADYFDMGAGHVDPSGMIFKRGSIFNPGLVYDADFFDYLGYLCEVDTSVFGDPAGTCGFLESIGVHTDAKNLNLASIGVGQLLGTVTVERTVTSVTWGNRAQMFHVHVDAPEGFDVSVSPSKLVLKPGESATYEVTITNDGTAPSGEYRFGSLTWETGGHHWGRHSRDHDHHHFSYSVKSPIAVRALLIGAPAELGLTGESGSTDFDIEFGYEGDYTPSVAGLTPAFALTDVVEDDPGNDWDTATIYNAYYMDATPGALYARFATFDDYTDGNDDIDMYIYGYDAVSGWGEIGSSGSGTSNEVVSFADPTWLAYYIFIHGWETDGPDAVFTLFIWEVEGTAAGNLSIDSAPSSGTMGSAGVVSLSWSGLAVDTKYLGIIVHANPDAVLDYTVVAVFTD